MVKFASVQDFFEDANDPELNIKALSAIMQLVRTELLEKADVGLGDILKIICEKTTNPKMVAAVAYYWGAKLGLRKNKTVTKSI